MHWVWCTGVNGDKVTVNLHRVASMMRGKGKNAQGAVIDVTLLFLGPVAMHPETLTRPDGTVGTEWRAHYANTQVLETPEQIFTLPRIEIAPARPTAKTARK